MNEGRPGGRSGNMRAKDMTDTLEIAVKHFAFNVNRGFTVWLLGDSVSASASGLTALPRVDSAG